MKCQALFLLRQKGHDNPQGSSILASKCSMACRSDGATILRHKEIWAAKDIFLFLVLEAILIIGVEPF